MGAVTLSQQNQDGRAGSAVLRGQLLLGCWAQSSEDRLKLRLCINPLPFLRATH